MEKQVREDHVREGDLELVIPEKPPSVSVDELMALFESVNFFDPSADYYYNPVEQLRSDITNGDFSKESLKGLIQQFINRIKNKEVYQGTPPAGTPALVEYYKTIENAVTHTIKKISELGNTPHAKTQTAKMVIAFIRAATHCGTAPYTASIHMYKAIVKEQSLDLRTHCLESLAEYRAIIAESMAPRSSESIEYYKRFMRQIGTLLGIPGAHLFSESSGIPTFGETGGDFDATRDTSLFWKRYSLPEIASWITCEINNNRDLLDSSIDWLHTQFLLTWETAQFDKEAKIIAKEVSNRRGLGQTHEEIRTWLQAEPTDEPPGPAVMINYFGNTNTLTQENFDKLIKEGCEDNRRVKFKEQILDVSTGKVTKEAITLMLKHFGIFNPQMNWTAPTHV